MYLFLELSKTIPNSIELIVEKKNFRKLVKLLKSNGFEAKKKRVEIDSANNKSILKIHFVVFQNLKTRSVICIELTNKELFITVLYDSFESVFKTFRQLKKFQKKVLENRISIILENENGRLYLKKQDINPIKDIDLSLNYGEDFVAKDKLIREEIAKDNTNSLILLHGKPGTGKTTYIRNLISRFNNKEFILAPVNIMENIDNPRFLTFMLNYQNSILILEDAEKLIRKRDESDNNLIGLLNTSDGILGDILKLKIILTFNTEKENIDPALLRKGRLKVEHHFDALSVENSNRLFDKLGKKIHVDRPYLLTEVYNTESESIEIETTRRIGF